MDGQRTVRKPISGLRRRPGTATLRL